MALEALAAVLGTMGTPALIRALALLVRGLVAGTTPSLVATKKLTAAVVAARAQQGLLGLPQVRARAVMAVLE